MEKRRQNINVLGQLNWDGKAKKGVTDALSARWHAAGTVRWLFALKENITERTDIIPAAVTVTKLQTNQLLIPDRFRKRG